MSFDGPSFIVRSGWNGKKTRRQLSRAHRQILSKCPAICVHNPLYLSCHFLYLSLILSKSNYCYKITHKGANKHLTLSSSPLYQAWFITNNCKFLFEKVWFQWDIFCVHFLKDDVLFMVSLVVLSWHADFYSQVEKKTS